jgi:hypothetical protein
MDKVWRIPSGLAERIERACYHAIQAPMGIAPRTKRPLTATSEMTAHHWLNFAKTGYGKYLLSQHFKQDTLFAACALLDFTQACLSSTITAEVLDWIHELQATVAEDLQDGKFPVTEHSIVLHLMLFHIPDTIRFWGPVRHYWCFPFER